MLVTKESNNMYMWNQNNSNVGQKSTLPLRMYGEAYNHCLSVDKPLHETNTSSPQAPTLLSMLSNDLD